MKVSVVIPGVNELKYFPGTLQSLFRQTMEDWELLVSVEHNQDEVISFLDGYKSDKRIRVFVKETDESMISHKNYLFSAAEGEWITGLNPYDLLKTDRFERQLKVAEQNTAMQMIACINEWETEDGALLPAEPVKFDYIIDEIPDHYPFCFSSILFRNSVWKRNGGFSAYFDHLYGEEFHWLYRANKKFPIYVMKDACYIQRILKDDFALEYDNPRNLIVAELLEKLSAQQKELGTDWLEMGMSQEIRRFEDSLLSNQDYLAEKYRIRAAVLVDNNQIDQASMFIKKAMHLRKNSWIWRTYAYYLRQKYLKIK